MPGSTLFPLGFLGLLVLAACQPGDSENSAVAAPPDLSEWRLASGKTPTQAEFAALAATCETTGGATDACFANLGLKKAAQ